jgi:hypothetical protein
VRRLSVVLALLLAGGALSAAAHDEPRDQAESAQAVSTFRGAEPAEAASLRVALAFWLPVYYGMFIWLLTSGHGGGGAKRRAHDRGRLAAVPALVPVRASRVPSSRSCDSTR